MIERRDNGWEVMRESSYERGSVMESMREKYEIGIKQWTRLVSDEKM